MCAMVDISGASKIPIPVRSQSVSTNQVTFGNVRITAMSQTLLRVEPKGPRGFEDRPTFSIVGRDSFPGVPLTLVNQTDSTAFLSTVFYNIAVSQRAPLTPTDYLTGDAANPRRTFSYPFGLHVKDRDTCREKCKNDSNCRAWIYSTNRISLINCWPLSSFTAMKGDVTNRVLGCVDPSGCVSPITQLTITDKDGKVLYEQQGGPGALDNLLYVPAPLSTSAYCLTDYPRFFAPSWGATPIPSDAKVDPKLVGTNGYDFGNNVNGDSYIFLMGDSLDSYYKSRSEIVTLVGPTPVLPDYAMGTWFTWWHAYTETVAKDDLSHWFNNSLPIDIWGLDMNWRLTDGNKDHYYEYPNTSEFPDFGEWFSFLKQQGLRTYFNDHPFPVADQTTPKEGKAGDLMY